jgi:hypothetical protein
MKHLFFLLFLPWVVFAQDLPLKGDMTIGGNLLFVSTNYPNSSATIISFTPQFSYFVANKTEIGVSVSFQSEKYSSMKNSQIGIGPFLSAYLTTSDIKPFLGISYTYFNESLSYSGYGSDDESRNSFSLYGGLLFPLNQKVAVQPILQHSFYFGKDIQLGDITQLLFGIGIKAFL